MELLRRALAFTLRNEGELFSRRDLTLGLSGRTKGDDVNSVIALMQEMGAVEDVPSTHAGNGGSYRTPRYRLLWSREEVLSHCNGSRPPECDDGSGSALPFQLGDTMPLAAAQCTNALDGRAGDDDGQ